MRRLRRLERRRPPRKTRKRPPSLAACGPARRIPRHDFAELLCEARRAHRAFMEQKKAAPPGPTAVRSGWFDAVK
eukprot:6453112-Pyramimonas_sp.AAC.1